jgi:4-amino-4-deoxy-L-arabinose transferase-like glycosyltransferase
MEPSHRKDRPGNLGLAAVVLVAIAARLAVIVPVFLRVPADPDNYFEIAAYLAEGLGYQLEGRFTAYRPPLYPLLLTPLVWGLDVPWWGIFGLHVVLGAATVDLTYRTARRWGLAENRALLAALVVALDPVLVAQARLLMTETLAALTIALALWLLAAPGTLRTAVLGGLGLGLAALCRPSILPAAGLIAGARLVVGPGSGRSRVLAAVALVAATAAPLVPWAIRNARVFGEPVWTTTHGGYTLTLANNPAYYDEVVHGPPGAVWGGPRQALWWQELNRRTFGLLEPEADRVVRRLALETIAERPGDFLRASLARLGRFWGLAPSAQVYSRPVRLAIAAWTVPLWVALVVGLLRRDAWRWPRIAAPLLLIGFTCVHAVFWTDLRMRAPLVPAIALVAAGAARPRRITAAPSP